MTNKGDLYRLFDLEVHEDIPLMYLALLLMYQFDQLTFEIPERSSINHATISSIKSIYLHIE